MRHAAFRRSCYCAVSGMRLTSFADFGLRTLIFFADRDGEMLFASEIADHFGGSRHNIPPFIPTLIQHSS